MKADQNKQSRGRSGVQEIHRESNQLSVGEDGGGQNKSIIAACPLLFCEGAPVYHRDKQHVR